MYRHRADKARNVRIAVCANSIKVWIMSSRNVQGELLYRFARHLRSGFKWRCESNCRGVIDDVEDVLPQRSHLSTL